MVDQKKNLLLISIYSILACVVILAYSLFCFGYLNKEGSIVNNAPSINTTNQTAGHNTIQTPSIIRNLNE